MRVLYKACSVQRSQNVRIASCGKSTHGLADADGLVQGLLVPVQEVHVVSQASAEMEDLPVCVPIGVRLSRPELDGGCAIQERQLSQSCPNGVRVVYCTAEQKHI